MYSSARFVLIYSENLVSGFFLEDSLISFVHPFCVILQCKIDIMSEISCLLNDFIKRDMNDVTKICKLNMNKIEKIVFSYRIHIHNKAMIEHIVRDALFMRQV